VPTLVIARTDADAANLLLSNHDPRDAAFLTGERSSEGFYHVHAGIEQAIARGVAYAPYADLVWCETSRPDLREARQFAEAIRNQFPDKLMAYNCSPSFNWQANLDQSTMTGWREELAAMGYRFQFITLAGWHALNLSMFELATAYRDDGMYGYSQLQQREFGLEHAGYRATKHQTFVGTGYFDAVQAAITAGQCSTAALIGSTEQDQFHVTARAAMPERAVV
jgi:isocitrate lyase